MKIRFVRHKTFEHMVEGEGEVGIVFDDRHIKDSKKRGLAAYAMHEADGKGGIIHYWFERRIPLVKRLEVLAHEIGHLTGLALLNDVLEEKRADDYGRAAIRAFKEATRK